jgi:C1A family cysteine protease
MKATAICTRTVRLAFVVTIAMVGFGPSCTVLSQARAAAPAEFALGDEPVSEQYYLEHLLNYESLQALSLFKTDFEQAPVFDARDRGWVTKPKDQGRCGSCWAFATVGTIESRILKTNGPEYDLSEQQQVSCNLNMRGCCGGSGTALLFYGTNKPWLEASASYSEKTTACPTERTKQCGDLSGSGVNYLATGFYTVEPKVATIKKSIVEHGPSYFRYDVYEDFFGYWQTVSPGKAYTQKTGARKGGHAVLIIGWSDVKKAWLLKNSWKSDQGPNQDGTFWLSYDGHANDLKIQMFNITTLSKTN